MQRGRGGVVLATELCSVLPWCGGGERPGAAPSLGCCSPAHSLLLASSKAERGPGAVLGSQLGITCPDPVPVPTELRCQQDAADAKGLLPRGCPAWAAPPTCGAALELRLVHRAAAERCQLWVQDEPWLETAWGREMQVGGASLGRSGGSPRGASWGARLGLGDLQGQQGAGTCSLGAGHSASPAAS